MVGRHGRPAVQALEVVLELLRDGRVALAPGHVVDRLCGDHLPDRRHQRRIAQVLPDAVRLFENLAQAVRRVAGIELAIDVLEHEAGHAVAEDAGVDAIRHRAQVLDVAALQLLDVVLDIPHLFEIEAGVELAAFKRGHHAFGCRL